MLHVSPFASEGFKAYGHDLQSGRAALNDEAMGSVPKHDLVGPFPAAESDGLAVGQLGDGVKEGNQLPVYLDLFCSGRGLGWSGHRLGARRLLPRMRPPTRQNCNQRRRHGSGRQPAKEQAPKGLRVEG